jgi:predicted DNA-binding antitoxin AbrB/MazE fold protein
MSIEVEATYEDGVLKLDKPLPLNEHERVTIEIKPKISLSRQHAGFMKWTGDPNDLRRIAEDPEFGILESP